MDNKACLPSGGRALVFLFVIGVLLRHADNADRAGGHR